MSVQAIAWVLDHSQATLGARLVAISVANHADKDGARAWASIATYASEARLSRRQTQYALRDLEALGELRRAGRHGDRADRLTFVYEFPGMIDGAQNLHPADEVRGAIPDTTGRSIRHDGAQPTAHKPSLNRRTSNSSSDRDDEVDLEDLRDPFDAFWSFYPRKIAKGAARKAFTAALKRADAETILAGLQRFRRSIVGAEPRFIPHPATWLNADRWLDEEPPAAPAPAPAPYDPGPPGDPDGFAAAAAEHPWKKGDVG